MAEVRTMNASDRAELIACMAGELHVESRFEDAVRRVIDYALACLLCDSAAVLLQTPSGLVVGGASDDTAEAIARSHLDLNAGPALACADGAPDVLDDEDYRRSNREWRDAADGLGVALTLATPLTTGAESLGALVLAWNSPHVLSGPDRKVARTLARHSAVALRTIREEEGLRTAIEGRTVIGQAQGILMERYGLDGQRAFQVLARYSQDGNLKLVEVARSITATRRLPE